MIDQQTEQPVKVNRHHLFVKETVIRRYEVDLPAGGINGGFAQVSEAQDIVRERIAAGDRGTVTKTTVSGPQWDFAEVPR